MGLVLEIGVEIRKFAVTSNRRCYRSVRNHPFLVGMLLFLIFLYRSFPFVFSLLLSASPVLVCTALLLGTLLSFGQSNIPEIEKEEKLTHDVASLTTQGSAGDTVVVDRDGSFSIQTFLGKTRDIVDTSIQEAGYTNQDRRVRSEIEDHDDSVVYAPLINDHLQDNQNEKREIEDVERELDSPELENLRNIHDHKLGIEGIEWGVEAIEQQYTLVRQVEDDSSPRQSVHSYKGKGDHLDSSLAGGGGDDEADQDVDYETSDSESDRAESSSPDASMADILPMLDELHPLLDSEAPEPAHMSQDESDAASDLSERSNAGSVESDKETENHGEGVEDDGVDYNDADEEEAHVGKEDESKSAIKWTEDDQKNLMDLGNLELERNQRLENLIARRRAKKSFKITAEKNLIDFDSADLPFNVPPISTARHNPFDLPYDSFDNLGLPPIPGSAPSVLLPRRNPFDLPYESNEEKPDLKGDHFEQEFMALHSKDAFLRRHESFNLGSSSLGHAKQERQDFKWKPIFAPERLAYEGTSSSSFQRQLSGISESKLSSVPDTESVSSAADLDERKFSEEDFPKDTQVISNIYHAPDLVEQGSQSSEDVDSLEIEEGGKGDVQCDELEIKLGEPSLSGTGGLVTLVEDVTNEIHLKPEPVEEDSSSTSSLSSFSELDEKISDVMKGQSTSLEPRGEDVMKDFVISPQPSLEESQIRFMSGKVEDIEHKEPVYDSTPLPTEKILSFNSISFDMQAEISEMVTPMESAEMQVPFVDQDSEVRSESSEKGTSGYAQTIGATSKVHASDEIERSLGTSTQLNLPCSHSVEDIHLPVNLDVKTASSDCQQSVLSENEPPLEQEKVLSWSDKSMVEPYFDDHVEAHIINEDIDDVKEIDAGLLSELDAVGDFRVKVVGEPLHTDELIPEEANVPRTELGDLIQFESNQELPVLEARSIEDIDMDFKKIHHGLDVPEVMLPSVFDHQLEVEAENTVQTSSEFPIVEDRSLEDIVTALKQVSEGNVNELPKMLAPEDGSTELPLEYIHTVLKRVSEVSNVCEVPESLYSKDESEEAGTKEIASSNIESGFEENITTQTALEQASEGPFDELPESLYSNDGLEEVATKEIASSNIESSIEENITMQTALEQASEGPVDEPPESSSSKDGLEEVATKEIASSNIQSSVEENIITQTALEQVSEGPVEELPESSYSKDGSEEVGTKEIASSNIQSSVEENMITQTALEQVSEGPVDELPESSYSKDGSEEVGTKEIASSNIQSSVEENMITQTALEQVSEGPVDEQPESSYSKDGSEEAATKEIASSNIKSSVKENIVTQTALEQVLEGPVDELPKPSSNADGGSEDVETKGMSSTEEIASSNIVPGVEENITSHIDLKQVSEKHVDELPKPTSNSNDGWEEVGTNATDTMEEIASSNILSSVQENIATLKQVSESSVGELPKPTANSKEGMAEAGINAMASTSEIASGAMKPHEEEIIIIPTGFNLVSGSNVDDELPKPTANSKEGLAEAGINAMASIEEIASGALKPHEEEMIIIPTGFNLVSGSNVDDALTKSSKSLDGLAEVGPDAADVPIDNIRHEN